MPVAWRILVCACLTYVISQFYRSANAVIGPDLMTELRLTPDDLGILTGAFFLTFSVSQLPVGIALDRWGPRRTILTTLAVALVGALAFANGRNLFELSVARVILGFGCAALLIGPLVLFSRWFPADRFAQISGILIAVGNLGVIASTAPLAWFSATFGWRAAFYVTATITVLLIVMSFFVIRDHPDPQKAKSGAGESLADALRGVGTVIRHPAFPYLFVIIFTAYATFITILGLWGGPFLHDVHGLDSAARGNVMIFMAVGAAAGYFIWGPLDRVFNTRKWLLAAGVGGQVVCLAVIVAIPGLSLLNITILFTLLGILNGCSVMIFAHARSVFPPELVGRSMTTLNIGTMGGAAFQQIVTGYLMTWQTPPGSSPDETAYRIMFGLQAVWLLAALLFYLRTPDAKPNQSA
ncbi:MAG TPA: MFS transporter [Ferrovibrio sp.]|uniref:MFS transporter n=1 Tax=Ferrovibrio sp. TaxID=1917215 RepID=UPI002B4AAD94|nr:MFS transporter [Ferrovibrio sp.]HLT78988.1 MFS transporter [Ferrovibrio sp.]